MTMSIVHVLPTFDLGGLGSLSLALAKAWKKSSRHTFVAPRYPGTRPMLKPEVEAAGFTTYEVRKYGIDPMQYVMDLVPALVDTGPFDASVIYNFNDHVWSSMALRRAGVRKIICHIGTIMPQGCESRVGRMLSSPYTLGVNFIPASAAVKARIEECSPRYGTIMPVIWNGVELHAFAKSEGPRAPGPLRFGFVGRMAPEAKDFPLLIDAFKRSRACHEKIAELQLVGDGPLRSQYEFMAHDAPIRFLGPQSGEQVRAFLKSLDVFVMAALPIEGMSIALVEAIATGLPIIATDVPANREVLGGVSGEPDKAILVERSPIALSIAIDHLTFSDARRAQYAEISKRYSAEFSIQACAAKYAEVLESMPL